MKTEKEIRVLLKKIEAAEDSFCLLCGEAECKIPKGPDYPMEHFDRGRIYSSDYEVDDLGAVVKVLRTILDDWEGYDAH